MTSYLGVSWSKERQNWMARIKVDGQRIFLGRFIDPVKAALAYDAAARLYRGEKAKTNFQEGTAMAVKQVTVKTAKLAEKAECPICLQEFYKLNASGDVCGYHAKWFVTICSVCKKACFSDAKGICPNCGALDTSDFHAPVAPGWLGK